MAKAKEKNLAQPAIIFLPGFLASGSYWKKVTRLIERHSSAKTYSIDLLGFGSAEKPASSHYTYDDHVSYIRDQLRKRNLIRPEIPLLIVGHSMGAMVAARYSIDYPDEVSEVVLVNPPLYKSREQAWSTLKNTSMIYRAILDSDIRNFIWPILRIAGPFAHHTNHSREMSLRNVILPSVFIEDLARISHDYTLVVGLRDRAVYLENLRTITQPRQMMLIKIDSDHHSPQNASQEIADIILDKIQAQTR